MRKAAAFGDRPPVRLPPRGRRRPRTPAAGLTRARVHRVASSLIALAALPTLAVAQIVRIPTVTISPEHQLEILPSRAAAMGGVSIAIADPLLDPFVNPAKASRIDQARLFSSPGVFGVSGEAGGGWTLPLGALARSGAWFGGFSVGVQDVDVGEQREAPPVIFDECAGCTSEELDLWQGDPSQRNRYGFALLGRELQDGGLSLGGSMLWSGLEAVDGVDRLYPGSVRFDRLGHELDVRIGALKQWAGDRSLEVLALYNRFRATHEALYLDSFWDPGERQQSRRPRLERNFDRTSLWGLHIEYERPLADEGWRIGWMGTANYQSHPAMPDYEIASVSRDRGRSTALDLGVGLARSLGTSTFGVDLIYEPIWSHTWAATSVPVETPLNETIATGGKVLENRYRFSNAVARMGVEQEAELAGSRVVGLQLGLTVRRIAYRLEQRDHVQLRERNLAERWMEWTPTWGLALRTPGIEVRYRGQLTGGIHRPGLARPPSTGCFGFCIAGALDASILPAGPLRSGAARDLLTVSVHQISFSLPLGSGGSVRASPRAEGAREESR